MRRAGEVPRKRWFVSGLRRLSAAESREGVQATLVATVTPLRKKILGFNGVRGLCVILVFLWHRSGVHFHSAEIGVWTFLALSGFLLIPELHAQRLLVESGTSTELRETGRFWFKRATRILPVYYAVLLALFVFSSHVDWMGSDLGFRYHLVYLSNVFFALAAPPDTLGGPLGVLWTLSVEQQFYFVAPAIFLVLPSRHHISFCCAAAALCGVGHLWLTGAGASTLIVYMMSPWNFGIILLGGLAGLICRKNLLTQKFSEFWLPVSLLVILAFAASSLAEATSEGLAYAVLTIVVTMAIALMLGAIYNSQGGWFTAALEWSPLERLGQISYGFYLFHNFVPNPLGRIYFVAFGSLPSNLLKVTLGAAIVFVISTVAAYVSWTYFERPIIQFRERALKQRAKPLAG
jgi:peptidoglycan/LPS O-acetylase OafA/YrhL